MAFDYDTNIVTQHRVKKRLDKSIIDLALPIPVTSEDILAKIPEYGFEVKTFREMNMWGYGLFYIDSYKKETPIFMYDDEKSEQSKMFWLCHALYYLIGLFPECDKNASQFMEMGFYDVTSFKYSKEAQRYALSLLMPEEQFRIIFEDYTAPYKDTGNIMIDWNGIGRKFGVPYYLVQERANHLDLVNFTVPAHRYPQPLCE